MATARELVVRLLLNAAGFKNEVRAAQGELDKTSNAADKTAKATDGVGKSAGKAGKELKGAAEKGGQAFEGLYGILGKVAVFLGGMALIKSTASNYLESATAIERTADSLGMSMEALQAWEGVAAITGGSAEEMGDRFRDLNDYIQDLALHDSGPLKDITKDLGLNIKAANGQLKDTETFMLELSDAMHKAGNQKAVGLGKQLSFDNATIALLQKGRGEVEAYLKQQKAMAVYSKQDAEMAQKVNVALYRLSKGFESLGAMAMRVLGPSLEWLVQKFGDVVIWMRENETSLTVFLTALATIVAVAVTPALWAMATAAWAAIAPFAPIIALVAGLAFIVEDLVVYINGGESALEGLWKKFGEGHEIAARLKIIWAGIKDTFSALFNLLGGLSQLLGAIFTGGQLYSYKDAVTAISAAFQNLGKIAESVLGYIKDKLKNILPGWAMDLLGWSNDSGVEANGTATPSSSSAAAATPRVSPGDAQRPAGMVDNSRKVESTTTIQTMTIQTQSTDADGIARDITESLPNRVAQADGAYGL